MELPSFSFALLTRDESPIRTPTTRYEGNLNDSASTEHIEKRYAWTWRLFEGHAPGTPQRHDCLAWTLLVLGLSWCWEGWERREPREEERRAPVLICLVRVAWPKEGEIKVPYHLGNSICFLRNRVVSAGCLDSSCVK